MGENILSEQWQQDGTMIWSPEDNGLSAVVCQISEPYSQFVEHHPLGISSKNWDEQMLRAHRLVAAHNAVVGIPTAALEAGCIAELVKAARTVSDILCDRCNALNEDCDGCTERDDLESALTKLQKQEG